MYCIYMESMFDAEELFRALIQPHWGKGKIEKDGRKNKKKNPCKTKSTVTTSGFNPPVARA